MQNVNNIEVYKRPSFSLSSFNSLTALLTVFPRDGCC